MTSTEIKYSQMEKEMLAVTFATERFNQFGRDIITVLTDHKSLEAIMKMSIQLAPKRLQRMRLRLLRYHLDVKYQKGTLMKISDHLWRSAVGKSNNQPSINYEIFRVNSTVQSDRRHWPSLLPQRVEWNLERSGWENQICGKLTINYGPNHERMAS